MENLSLDEQIRKNEKLKKIEEAKFASSISESEQKLINAVHEKKSKEEILKLEEDIAAVIKQKEESLANLKKSEKILQDQRKAADERKAEADKLEKLRLEVKHDSESGEREEAEKWDKHRKDTVAALTDPKAFMISFLKKQALDALEKRISKKKRMEIAKEDEEKVEKKKKSDNEMLARENEYRNAIMDRNEIKSIPTEDGEIKSIPTEDRNELLNSDAMNEIRVSLGSDDKLDTLINSVDQSNQTQSDQLRQDSDQWKADQRTSASEEAGAGIGVATGDAPSIGGVEKPEKPKKKGVMDGLGGIIGNIMKKFGKAGKFLMSLGSKFLMPLLTTPVGWGILAGLAVGGLVFAYWDDIMAVVGKIFDKVKGFFSSVGNSISKGISAIGDAISSIIDFFNPLNLIPMIARALLPTKMYDAISGAFTGKSTTEDKSDKKKEELSTLNEEGDEMEAELNTMQSDQLDLGRSLNSRNVIAYSDPDGDVHTISVGEKFAGRQLVTPSHARWHLRKAGMKVLDPVETNAVMNENELKIFSKENELDENTQQGEMLMDEIDTLDLKVKSEKKDDKPGNVVADLVRSGVIDWNVWGDSKVLDWEKLKSMDVINLKKVLDFNDWSDDTNSDLLNLITSKSPKVELDLPPVKPNEQNQKRKSDVMNQALQQGMDNRISGTQGQNGGSSGSQTNISAPTVNNNTTIKKEATHDTDVTARGLNKSAMMSLDDEF